MSDPAMEYYRWKELRKLAKLLAAKIDPAKVAHTTHSLFPTAEEADAADRRRTLEFYIQLGVTNSCRVTGLRADSPGIAELIGAIADEMERFIAENYGRTDRHDTN